MYIHIADNYIVDLNNFFKPITNIIYNITFNIKFKNKIKIRKTYNLKKNCANVFLKIFKYFY